MAQTKQTVRKRASPTREEIEEVLNRTALIQAAREARVAERPSSSPSWTKRNEMRKLMQEYAIVEYPPWQDYTIWRDREDLNDLFYHFFEHPEWLPRQYKMKSPKSSFPRKRKREKNSNSRKKSRT